MELVLTLGDIANKITTRNSFYSGSKDYDERTQKDKVCHVVLGLSFSDNILEQRSDPTLAKGVRNTILNNSEGHNLFNKQKARQDFHSVRMKRNWKVLKFIFRLGRPASVLKSVEVEIDYIKVTITVLSELPIVSAYIFTAMNAVGAIGEASLSIDLVESTRFQE